MLLGIDLGSSSVKTSLLDAKTGEFITSNSPSEKELTIDAPQPGWAEQDPAIWWKHVKRAIRKVLAENGLKPDNIDAVGISYQMHGLVIVDKDQKVLRPAIIWCDGRAVDIGERAYQDLGEDFCKQHFLRSDERRVGTAR